MKANKAALDGYRLGSGDTEIILSACTDPFNFTWLPDDDMVSRLRLRLPVFYTNFKADSEAYGRAKRLLEFGYCFYYVDFIFVIPVIKLAVHVWK